MTKVARKSRATLGTLTLALALVSAALLAGPASGDPAAIRAKRAEIQRIQSELARLDNEVEQAAEAYNGARWELGQVNARIQRNRLILNTTTRDLARARILLATRLRRLYMQGGPPSLVEVLLTSGSLTSVADGLDLLKRTSESDSRVVSQISSYRTQIEAARAQLMVDAHRARVEVARRAAAAERVRGLLADRQDVLSSAKGDLKRLLAEQAAHERQLVAEAAARARAAAAARQQASLAPASPFVGALPSGGAANAEAARIALRYLGVPYVWGGASPSGFDCSGLCSYVYAQVGKSVPHFTGAIFASFPSVSESQLQPGDLICLNGGDHVGIYIGNGQFVHAPHTGDVVRVASLSGRGDYCGAVRP